MRLDNTVAIVLLPTPLGPHNTISKPECCRDVAIQSCRALLPGHRAHSIEPLLHILHLFLQPINRALDLDNMPGNLGVVGFAADRVRLAK